MKEEVVSYLKRLGLPLGQYCAFGGASLAIRNIRESKDIDLHVTKSLYEKLKQAGWKEKVHKTGRMKYIVTFIDDMKVAAFHTSVSDVWEPKIAEYIAEPEMIAGFPFMPLSELYEWKAAVRRPRDVEDLRLIEEYWAKAGV